MPFLQELIPMLPHLLLEGAQLMLRHAADNDRPDRRARRPARCAIDSGHPRIRQKVQHPSDVDPSEAEG
jgi:hypothetical protein